MLFVLFLKKEGIITTITITNFIEHFQLPGTALHFHGYMNVIFQQFYGLHYNLDFIEDSWDTEGLHTFPRLHAN